MKLEKIELETAAGELVLATVYINPTWDIDSYLFEVDDVEVGGQSRPELCQLAEDWAETNRKWLTEKADEETFDWAASVEIWKWRT